MKLRKWQPLIQERYQPMNKSESIKELATALNKAQAEMSGAKKKGVNPFFKSKYADLNSVVDAVRIPFAENGLSYSQFPLFESGCVGVETILMHSSGEWISSVLMLPMVKQDPQAAGSAISYARRYSLQSVAGIPSEDDDGNATKATKPAVFSVMPLKCKSRKRNPALAASCRLSLARTKRSKALRLKAVA